MNPLLFDKSGKIRSGWRATIFLIVFVIVAVLLELAASLVMKTFGIQAAAGSPVYLAVNATLSLIPALFVGWLCGRILENLPFRALGASFTKDWFGHFFLGLLLGSITLCVAVFVAFVMGGERFEFNDSNGRSAMLGSLLVSFVVFGVAAAFEEVLFRGYVLQTFARSGLAWLAILLTSIFFGAVHLGNPNASLVSTFNTILAGIWFSVAYLRTRDLWFVWGLHLMWNWMQGSFFGIEVSGLIEISKVPLFREIDSGPTWLTGTSYGIEGGIACTVAIAISIGVIYLMPKAPVADELHSETKK